MRHTFSYISIHLYFYSYIFYSDLTFLLCDTLFHISIYTYIFILTFYILICFSYCLFLPLFSLHCTIFYYLACSLFHFSCAPLSSLATSNFHSNLHRLLPVSTPTPYTLFDTLSVQRLFNNSHIYFNPTGHGYRNSSSIAPLCLRSTHSPYFNPQIIISYYFTPTPHPIT